jgi:uncharacterized tellurite resistance protein B-like protein
VSAHWHPPRTLEPQLSDTTYADIRPLIANERLEGPRVVVMFRCTETGERHPAVAEMASSNDSAPRRFAEVQARATQWTMRQSLARSVSSMLGGGMASSLAHQAVMRNTAPAGKVAGRDQVFTEKDREDAVVRAFQSISHNFRRDSRGRWVSVNYREASPTPQRAAPRSAPPSSPAPAPRPAPASTPTSHRPSTPTTPRAAASTGHRAPVDRSYTPPARRAPAADSFAGLIQQADLSSSLDRRVMVRMLAEVALADGHISDSERMILKALGASPSDIETTHAPLEIDDLEETTVSAREAMVAMAMAVAYSDEEMDPDEVSRLEFYAEGFGISRMRRSQLDRMAREHLVELMVQRSLRGGAIDPRDERTLMAQAARLGISMPQVRRLIAQSQG